MNVRVISSDLEFYSVKNEWIEFEKKVNNKNITSSFFFQRTWWKHFGNINNDQFGYNKKLLILFLYNSKNDLRAIAPFCEVRRKIKKIFWYKSIEFIGQQFCATSLDFISENLTTKEKRFIFRWLKKNIKYDLIKLQYIPEYTYNFDLNSSNITILSACPEIEGEEYFNIRKNFYSRNLKHKLNRIRNKIKREKKDIKFNILKGKKILNYFDEIIKISSTKELSNKHSSYNVSEKRYFLHNLIRVFSPNSNCVFLSYQDKLYGYNWGIYYNQKYYALDAAYSRKNKELKEFSIGNLIYDQLIINVLSKGIKIISLGTGIDPYKLKFSKKLVKIYTYVHTGNTTIGYLLYRKMLTKYKKKEKSFFNELEKNLK